jgi:hypothetical protein
VLGRFKLENFSQFHIQVVEQIMDPLNVNVCVCKFLEMLLHGEDMYYCL